MSSETRSPPEFTELGEKRAREMNPSEPGEQDPRRSRPSEAAQGMAEGGELREERPTRRGTSVRLAPTDIELAFVPTSACTKIELRRVKGA